MLNKEYEKNKTTEGEGELRAKLDLGTKFFNLFNVEGEGNGRISGSSSQKVLETFEVKTTKSIILNDIIENSKVLTDLQDIQEGELIRIDNVSLSLENEAELRMVKLVTSNSFKGLTGPGANDVDYNNLFNSLFKDYAYKLKGNLSSTTDELLIKIPLTFESEFESSYSVDDLFIGQVSLVGIYKGKIKRSELKNSFQFFQEIGTMQQLTGQNNDHDEIQSSQYANTSNANGFPLLNNSQGEEEFFFIDVLSIVQIINTPKKS